MRKTYSDAVILDVLARCEAERPEVPLEWIQAALSRTRADGAAPRQGSFFNNNRGSERPFYEVVAERSRSEEHTSELQSLMRISYAVFCLKKKRKYKHLVAN